MEDGWHFKKTLMTLALGFAGGMLFFVLGLPAPFMLGSLLTCWFVGGLFPQIRGRLGMGKSIRRFFLAAVAVFLGSYVTAEIVDNVARSWPSVAILMACAFAMAWGGYLFLTKICKHDPVMAWFASQPAGLSEVTLASREYTDKDHIVALFHLVRVSTIFTLTPLIIWFFATDFDPRAVPNGQAHLWEVPWTTWPILVALIVCGVLFGKLLRLPIAWMLGPMLLTALVFAGATLAGLDTEIELAFARPFELVCFLQIGLGAPVGARMAQAPFRELSTYVRDAYVQAFGMLGIAALGAWIASLILDAPMIQFLLAISPGGLSELSLLSVALGFEVAFVTLHHLIRMAFVLAVMPWGTRRVIAASQDP